MMWGRRAGLPSGRTGAGGIQKRRPQNHADGRYIWLPIQWEGDKPILRWMDEWPPQFSH
jgi:hypothetical protein